MPISAALAGHVKDLGNGFMIRRLLPSAQKQALGPFVFMDHFGPVTQQPGESFDVRPHPHIGLATVTYLFEGAILHRDSLGSIQRIEPGAINWMTAGRGIVHSERTPDDLRQYSLSAPVTIDGTLVEARQLAVLDPDRDATITVGDDGGRYVVLGGEPLDGQRHIWWNFVPSSRERLEAAKRDWREQRFPSVPGETEFIPLPER